MASLEDHTCTTDVWDDSELSSSDEEDIDSEDREL